MAWQVLALHFHPSATPTLMPVSGSGFLPLADASPGSQSPRNRLKSATQRDELSTFLKAGSYSSGPEDSRSLDINLHPVRFLSVVTDDWPFNSPRPHAEDTSSIRVSFSAAVRREQPGRVTPVVMMVPGAPAAPGYTHNRRDARHHTLCPSCRSGLGTMCWNLGGQQSRCEGRLVMPGTEAEAEAEAEAEGLPGAVQPLCTSPASVGLYIVVNSAPWCLGPESQGRHLY
ncbi:hypothetical protein EYF80_020722 [Liparis tanakae]|uniref:Uncharacterized protein n=1 Tax=Liparis tanakae TaxID=230148 RepID=A0A4Z2HT91_9TELE|nr:hypothetical protein EYF80_020722 [Liparis tanakae]